MNFLYATRWSVRIETDGTWRCEHIDERDEP